VALLGTQVSPLASAEMPPTVIMLVGLQGCGKTTVAGKLGVLLKGQGKLPLLVAADTYRPAAVDQLRVLGETADVPVFSAAEFDDKATPVEICRRGVAEARATNRSAVILDTAGRLSIDDAMMVELEDIRTVTEPDEILFVADGMLGQDAVETAVRFHKQLAFTGCVLTKLDGDARGGAALSIRESTGAPIKFMGMGERLEALEPFHPERIASRILGMGDVVSLVEKAEKAIDQDRAKELEERLRKQAFTFDDFREQLQAVKSMGPLDQLMGMIPGVGKALKGVQTDDNALGRVEAIINSMTALERVRPQILNGSRRQRIARGSGTSVQDVNRLLKQFQSMQKMMRQMSQQGKGGRRRPPMFTPGMS
jgi:signal recognition particle subunit SRP54